MPAEHRLGSPDPAIPPHRPLYPLRRPLLHRRRRHLRHRPARALGALRRPPGRPPPPHPRPQLPPLALPGQAHPHRDRRRRQAGRLAAPVQPPRRGQPPRRPRWPRQAAIAPDERTRAPYLVENVLPVEERGRLRLVDGETKVTDEVVILPAPGHPAGHRLITLKNGG